MSVVDESLLGLILYNYFGVVVGIDMDLDFFIKLVVYLNIVGIKFICGNMGKLMRVVLVMEVKILWVEGLGYMVFGGMCDFIV